MFLVFFPDLCSGEANRLQVRFGRIPLVRTEGNGHSRGRSGSPTGLKTLSFLAIPFGSSFPMLFRLLICADDRGLGW